MPSVSLRSCSLCLLHVPDVLAAVLPCLPTFAFLALLVSSWREGKPNHFKSHVDVLN